MVIRQLTISNVKRIRAVNITPDGSAVLIAGRNEQGKTSILDAIAMLLGGKDEFTAAPLRRGAESGFVSADLGEVVATRTWKAGGSDTLKLEAKLDAVTRAAIKSPQTRLDERLGSLSFDPTAFLRERPERQAELLRNLVGIDTRAEDARRKSLYDERTIVNRQVRDAEGSLRTMPQYEGVPLAPVTTADLQAEMQTARQINNEKADAERAAIDANGDVSRAMSYLDRVDSVDAPGLRTNAADRVAAADRDVKAAEEALEAAKIRATEARRHSDSVEADIAERRNSASVAVDNTKQRAAELRAAADALPTADEAAILAKFGQAEDTNRKIAANEARAREASKVQAMRDKSDALTAQIDDIDSAKIKALADAKFPVPGLGFDEAGMVTFDGLPLSEASAAQKIRIGVAMGLAANPEIRVMRIYDGSNLDRDNLKLIADMAEAANAQVWIERADRDDAGAVFIEDGEVVDQTKTAEPAAQGALL